MGIGVAAECVRPAWPDLSFDLSVVGNPVGDLMG